MPGLSEDPDPSKLRASKTSLAGPLEVQRDRAPEEGGAERLTPVFPTKKKIITITFSVIFDIQFLGSAPVEINKSGQNLLFYLCYRVKCLVTIVMLSLYSQVAEHYFRSIVLHIFANHKFMNLTIYLV